MNTLDHALSPGFSRVSRLPRATRLACELLQRLRGGAVELALPNGDRFLLGEGLPVARWQVHQPRFFERVLATGDIGLAESWMDGDWDCEQLPELLSLLAANREVLQRAIYGSLWKLIGYRLWHLARANTREGARRNIEAHYDLGNAFYALWLDPGMSYSAALFDAGADSLEAAQHAKYRRILERIGPRPGQTILEVGCGWGGFAELAATEYGVRVHGITLSPSQLAWCRERAARGGYGDLASFSLTDYRDLGGSFDHLVSIEMFEAVGERFWPGYFRQLARCLRPGGRALVQSITIDEALFPRYRRGTDFIQRYVFPGGMLPSPAGFRGQAESAGLALCGDFAFGQDYARTLALWRERFEAARHEVEALGFDERFLRLWRFYLAYCEAGFRAGSTDVHQFELMHAARG